MMLQVSFMGNIGEKIFNIEWGYDLPIAHFPPILPLLSHKILFFDEFPSPIVLPPALYINVYDLSLCLSFHIYWSKDGSSWSWKYLRNIWHLSKLVQSKGQMIHTKAWMDQRQNRQTQSVYPIWSNMFKRENPAHTYIIHFCKNYS